MSTPSTPRSFPESWSRALRKLETKDLDAARTALLELTTHPERSPELHSLALHLLALLSFRRGRADEGARAMESASTLERDAGYSESAGHTLHAVALFNNVGGDLEKVRGYYRQSLDQLKKMKNSAGMGLCLRSLGEMALALGMTAQARTILGRSGQCLDRARPAEAPLVKAWVHALSG